MKLWRGIFNSSFEDASDEGFCFLPADQAIWLNLILNKILDNCNLPRDQVNLTSFSTSREIALRYASKKGWLVELEVNPREILDASYFLERALVRAKPISEEKNRIEEALQMSRQDYEIYLRDHASFEVSGIFMVGSIKS